MAIHLSTAPTPLTVVRPVVDDVSVRIVAAAVLTLVTLTALTGQWWIYGLLAVDFALRAAGKRTLSPLGVLVQHVARPRIRVAPRPTSAAPKRFAAGIGAVLTATAFVFWLAGVAVGAPVAEASPVVWGISAAMIAFPLLEAAFGLCVGCKMYAFGITVGLIAPDLCIDCAPADRKAPLKEKP